MSLNSWAAPVIAGSFFGIDPAIVSPAMTDHNAALTAAMTERGIRVMDLFGYFASDRFDSATRMITVGAHRFSVD